MKHACKIILYELLLLITSDTTKSGAVIDWKKLRSTLSKEIQIIKQFQREFHKLVYPFKPVRYEKIVNAEPIFFNQKTKLAY